MIKNKYYFFWLILSVTLAMAGCSSGDDEVTGLSDGQPEVLVGKWICTQIEADENGEVDVINPNSQNYYLLLNQDGSAMVRPANLFEDEKRGNVTWKVSGDKLLFNDGSEYTIKRANGEELVLEWLDYWDDDDYLKEVHTFKKEHAQEID